MEGSDARAALTKSPSSITRLKPVVGVCAMDNKARSKPMRNILDRLIAYEEFEVILFGDKVIMDEDISTWPKCDFLISFFSSKFPMQKAIDYIKLRKPFCINDLPMQQLLWDRRLVLCILDAIDVPTPSRILLNRDGGPVIPKDVLDKVNKNLGIDLSSINFDEEKVQQLDDDTILVGRKKLVKPFVEKPVNGEDHNIYIYYPKRMGGGVRRLFRKVGNKSSEYVSGITQIRMDGGSYIYEEFLDVDNSEDIKVYTIGPYFTHAETRKSPVVDGIVRRNTDGKEIRYVTDLSDDDQDIARRVCMAFGQAICGFDLLRVAGKSYVIDVNGWSFVKGNNDYYDMCSKILRDTFLKVARKRKPSFNPGEPMNENQWRLKTYVSVFRHADRTPKQKLKFTFSSTHMLSLYTSGTDESMLRSPESLKTVLDAAGKAIEEGIEDEGKLYQLKEILTRKLRQPGTKVQVKPVFKKNPNKINGNGTISNFMGDGEPIEKVQLIVKWGGEFTHAGRHHSQDLGDNLRKDLMIMNRKILDDVKIYTSSERRVIATADIFAKALLKVAELHQEYLIVNKEMLDDNFVAKEDLESIKIKLLEVLRSTEIPISLQRLNLHPNEFINPVSFLDSIIAILTKIREVFRSNYVKLDLESIMPRWCCAESPILFRERWEKLFKEFCDVDRSVFDPSKISELYDSLKYDALHHREFMERIFVEDVNDIRCKELLISLYRKAKVLFDFIAPQEFGLDVSEKLLVGKTIARTLLGQIVTDLEEARISFDPCTRLYFTKESHVHAILNIVLHCGIPCNIDLIEELDITFEVYERVNAGSGMESLEPFEYSLRIGLSHGAHDSNILDVQIDQKHALSVAPRKWITEHIKLDDAIQWLKSIIIQVD